MLLNIMVEAVTNNLIASGFNTHDEDDIVQAILMNFDLDTINLSIEEIFYADLMAEEVCAKHGDKVAHIYLAIQLEFLLSAQFLS